MLIVVMIVLRLGAGRVLPGGRLRRVALASIIGAPVLLAPCVAPSQTERGGRSGAPVWVEATSPAHPMPDVPTRLIAFDTTEGTFMSVDVSPDGQTLVFDLLGDIYQLPINGGDAIPITTGSAWDQTPRLSPDGRFVYFVSDRNGFKNIWRLALTDRSPHQVTQSDSDILGGLNWSQDGARLIVGRADRDPDVYDSEVVLHFVDSNNGMMTPIQRTDGPWFDVSTFARLRQRSLAYSAVHTADNQVYFSEERWDDISGGRHTVRMYNFDIPTQVRTSVTPEEASYSEYKPQLSHDGTLLAYFRQYPDRRTEVRIRNRMTGQDNVLVELTNADDASYTQADESRPNCAFTPDDRQLIFWHDGKIHRVDLADGSREIIPFRAHVEREVVARVQATPIHLSEAGEASVVRWPSLSLNGRTMAFVAIGYVWLMDMETSDVRRLTRSTDFEYMPTLSPDGQSVAYISFAKSGDEHGPGRLMVAEVNSGTRRELLGTVNETYLLPKWSPDGSMIAAIREVESDSDTEASFGWTLTASGEFHDVAPAPASDEYMSKTLYARFVSFDESSRELLFSYPLSRHETVLATAGLNGGDIRVLATGDADVAGIAPAPDLKNLALTRIDGSVWVTPFEADVERRQVSTLSPGTRRVSGSGFYVNWNSPRQITVGFGQKVHHYPLDGAEPASLRVGLEFEKPQVTQSIAFTGARLITMSSGAGVGPVIESGTIVVDRQRVAAVGSMDDVAIPSDSLVIDATGKTIMPGLLDTHYHRIARGVGRRAISAFKLPNPNFSDRSAIEYGVTTAWEPGGVSNDGAPATVDLQVAGRIAGPRWSHSARGTVGYPWVLLTSYTAALAAVEQHRELGVTTLKEYDTPTRDQRRWLSAAAYANGLGIVSHIETFDGMMTRIVDGFTGGDHSYVPVPFFKDVSELLRQTGYIWTPNIGITGGLAATGQDTMSYFCQAVAQNVSRKPRNNPGITDSNWICHGERGSRNPEYDFDTHRIGRVARQAASAAGNGIHIGVSAHSMPGSNLHREMWYLWRGGLPIEDVLRAATIGNAEKLGLQEEVGSLEVGKMADFLVLDENPLDDILNTLSLKYTVQGGVVYDSDTAEKVNISVLADGIVGKTSR